jgi:YesN/AraC family two-component response regulator
MRLKVLIVDDEPLAREGLKLLLARDSETGVSESMEARNGREAVVTIREEKPDLVLLDVQMPRMDGFAVVEAVGADQMPAVIFVTAHDKYAIRAFEISAVDYLLKPVTEERFRIAFERARKWLGVPRAGASMSRESWRAASSACPRHRSHREPGVCRAPAGRGTPARPASLFPVPPVAKRRS